MSDHPSFTHPNVQGYTVYSKSGCPYCTKVKQLLKEHSKEFVIVDCDEYLLEDKEKFLNFIEIIAGKKYRTFPMVFLGENFVGGFTETKSFIEKENAFVSLDF